MDNFEEELNKIRIEIYEEWKGLSNAEIAKLVGEHAREIAEQYHLKIIPESPRKTKKQTDLTSQQ